AAQVRLALAAGGLADGVEPRLAVPDAARTDADARIAGAGVSDRARAIGFVAAGTWGTKTWPVSHAARLARALIDAGWQLLVLSGPGEERTTATLARLAPGVRVLPPCGVGEMVAVVSRLAMLVGTDSGPRHVATA